jgi:hypothetical protein
MLMPFRIWIATLFVAAAGFAGVTAAKADDVAAVEPGGPGELTKCRNWLMASSCKSYKHIALPPRIQIGDKLTVSFGSSPKEFVFPVARIALKGQHCAIFSNAEGDRHEIDKINVAPCYRAKEEER